MLVLLFFFVQGYKYKELQTVVRKKLFGFFRLILLEEKRS